MTPDWHRIGTDWHGLARIGKLPNLCQNKKLAPDWHRIGTDWHGLARIGTDWHGLARIGRDWQIGEFVSERKIDPRLAQDWHGLAQIGTDCNGLAPDWAIGTGLARHWFKIGFLG